jgi:hypothetical protein
MSICSTWNKVCVLSTLSHFVHPFMIYSQIFGFHSIWITLYYLVSLQMSKV